MAGLIPQNFIDDLLNRVDILDVVESRVRLKKTGKNYAGLCPFHQEKSPSFTVEPEKQFYYCFGCGAGGNALGFIMNYENLDFPQAIESIARSMGLDVPREENPQARQIREQNQGLYEVLQQAMRYYQAQLRQHPRRARAVDYLKQRGLSGEVARDYCLGYAPPGWDNLLSQAGGGEAEHTLLQDAGLLIENQDSQRVYDRFRDRIMYPIRDARGRVVAFGGRVLGDDKPKYLNSPETAVFHKGEELYGLFEARRKVRQPERFLIVEGYMDVIALAQHGIDYSVATLGTATSASHLRRLFRLAPEVVFCFDGDAAGREAAWRALQQVIPLMEDGRSARFLFLPEGEDPDSQVRRLGREAFSQQISKAIRLADFFFAALQEKVDMQSLEGRASLAKLAMPLIRLLPAGVFRQLIRDELARRAGVDAHTLEQLETQHSAQAAHQADAGSVPPAAASPSAATSSARSSSPQPSPEATRPLRPAAPGRPPSGRGKAQDSKRSACMKAVNLLVLKPSIVTAVEISTELQEVQAPDIELLRQVIELARRYPTSDTPELLGRIYATPLGTQLVQLLNREQITPSEGIEHEFNDIIRHLLEVQRRHRSGAEKLAQARKLIELRRRPVLGDTDQGNTPQK